MRKTAILGLILLVMLVMPLASAEHAKLYFKPTDSTVPDGYGHTTTVEVWVNASQCTPGTGVNSLDVGIDYDPTCTKIVNVDYGPAGHWSMWTWNGSCNASGLDWITTWRTTDLTGDFRAFNLTFHCSNDSCPCCKTNLNFSDGVPPSACLLTIGNQSGLIVPPVLENGTLACGEPEIEVNKTVYHNGAWTDAITDAEIGDELRFRINVTNGPCCDYTNLVVNDTLPGFLTYNDNAIPFEPTGSNPYQWTFATLNKDETKTIEFNATVNAYGVGDNEADATAWCDEFGVQSSGDDTVPITAAPAYEAMIYLKPQDSGAPYCNTTDVEVWVNSTRSFHAGQVLLNYAGGCANVTDWTQNTAVFPHGTLDTSVDGTEWITFSRMDEITGDYLIGTLTIHCENSTDPCVTDLDLVSGISQAHGVRYSTLFYGDITEIKTETTDGTFTCGLADLIVDDIKVNKPAWGSYERPFGPTDHPGALKEINTLHAKVTNDGNADIVGQFNVCFYIDGVLFSVETVDELAAGASTWVDCSEDWYTFAGIDYVLNVTADCGDAVTESDETNNTLEEAVRSVVHGLKGGNWQDGRTIGNNITTAQGHVNLRYSAGNSTYWGAGDHVNWTEYAVEWNDTNIAIPNAATIKHARLYVYYTFGRITGDYYAGVNPEFELDFNGGTYTMDDAVNYTDIKGTDWSSFYNFPGGMLAYDVAGDFDETGNLAVLTNLREPSTEEVSMNGMVLIVIYEHVNEPDQIIYVNEGFDKLCARPKYGTNSTEATAYGVFSITEDINKFGKARLISIATDASQAQGAHAVAFNGEKWTGGNGTPILDPLAAGLYVDERDVIDYLEQGDNTAEYQSVTTPWGSMSDGGDYFDACNAILILEKGKKTVISVEPDETVVIPQDQFDIEIKVHPYRTAIPEGVYSVSYKLHYDTNILRAATQVKGDFLGQDGNATSVVINSIDEENGIIEYAETRVGSDVGGVMDPGILARIHFSAIGSPGAISNLNITDVVFVDSKKVENPWFVIEDGTVELFNNTAPVSKPTSKFMVTNAATKYNCYADLCACQSYDPDNSTGFAEGDEIIYIRWDFGDGEYGTSEGAFDENCQKLHKYTSWNWVGGEDGDYEPFLASLTVTDDGDPDLSGITYFDVVVYIAGDANGDGKVNVIDAAYVGKHWRETSGPDPEIECCHYWTVEQADKADLNNDRKVDLLDMAIVGANWEHTAWAP